MNDTKSKRALTEHFPVFIEEIHARAQTGAVEYGDRSYERPLPDLIDETMEELADVCGWSFITWARLRELKAKVAAIDHAILPRRGWFAWLRGR